MTETSGSIWMLEARARQVAGLRVPSPLIGYDIEVPAGGRLRPVDTGSFSRFGALSAPPGDGVEYPEDGFRERA